MVKTSQLKFYQNKQVKVHKILQKHQNITRNQKFLPKRPILTPKEDLLHLFEEKKQLQ
jgi:hypothetical protein